MILIPNRALDESRAAIKAGKKRPLTDVMKDLRQEIADDNL
ncbi:MAG: toxin-antitoxin system, antitoxin component, PHD domain protein [Firmicutes bacterium HGW-Firmicutes-4]|nr:MAG: toxin-antitoxin system, antitoxin component, PHD domain protein [Firmicutes bacterium HGW-Firmicutes-4]